MFFVKVCFLPLPPPPPPARSAGSLRRCFWTSIYADAGAELHDLRIWPVLKVVSLLAASSPSKFATSISTRSNSSYFQLKFNLLFFKNPEWRPGPCLDVLREAWCFLLTSWSCGGIVSLLRLGWLSGLLCNNWIHIHQLSCSFRPPLLRTHRPPSPAFTALKYAAVANVWRYLLKCPWANGS